MENEQGASLPSSRTILLVEDDSDNEEFLEILIALETSYHTLAMESGQEVLERIEEIKAVKPALFLLDYYLPTMTALQLYDQLHAMEEFKHIPALIISASRPGSILCEIAKRGLIFLEKPFEVDILITIMKHMLDSPSI